MYLYEHIIDRMFYIYIYLSIYLLIISLYSIYSLLLCYCLSHSIRINKFLFTNWCIILSYSILYLSYVLYSNRIIQRENFRSSLCILISNVQKSL